MSNNTLTVQRPYQDEECRANLDDFIHTDDRGSPPVFVGRESIITRIQDDVNRCRLNMKDGISYTRIISGAPGAGKSSLMLELRRRFGARDETSSPVTVVDLPHPKELSHDVDVAKAFIGAHHGHRVEPQASITKTGKVGVNAAIVSGATQMTHTPLTLEQQVELDNNPWLAVGRNTAVDTDVVFLLLVDEAQNLSGDNLNHQGRNPLLLDLHTGLRGTRGLKIVPVFLGLSNTQSVLYQRGLSRLGDDAHIQLGSLTTAESEELVSKWIRHEPFGLSDVFSDRDVAKVARIIRVASEGWPRHVTTYLKELGRSVLAHEGELVIDVDEMLVRGHEKRFQYYGERLTGAMLDKYKSAIYDTASGASNGVVTLEALASIAEDRYKMSTEDWKSRHQSAIHAGVFEKVSVHDDDRFRFPIPSLCTYAQVRGSRSAFMQTIQDRIATDLAKDEHGLGY